MNDLLKQLEALTVTGDLSDENLWTCSTELLEKSFVPQKLIGKDRPCEEKDFREYRQTVDRNLRNLSCMLQHILQASIENNIQVDLNSHAIQTFVCRLILTIGEHNELNAWNTAESISLAKELKYALCKMYGDQSLSQILVQHKDDNIFGAALLFLRPKLLKDTWKTYPAAVACYKWLLLQVEEPGLFYYIDSILPTALIILDDYMPHYRATGLECIHEIVKHARMKKELVNTGFADVIYNAVESLLHQREAKYILPLYGTIAILLVTFDFCNDFSSPLEWNKRDDVLSILLNNMEQEQDLELRHSYMSSLPLLLTNIGCAKWCDMVTRILSEYCEHHTDLRTLKATMEAAKAFLLTFHPRAAAHCTTLYTAFLKLHFDIIETPVFDKEILQNLEDCISLLHKLTPSVGMEVIGDGRISSVTKNCLHFMSVGDTRYFE